MKTEFQKKIIGELKPDDSIRRLRIFAHGNINFVVIGNLLHSNINSLTARAGEKIQIDCQDAGKVIQVIETSIKDPDSGKIVKKEEEILNKLFLQKLHGKFASKGWAELHVCFAAKDAEGKLLIKHLSKIWGVDIIASEDKQYPGGGLEGKVWIAKPNGSISAK